MWKEAVVARFKVRLSLLEGLRKPGKPQDSRYPGRYLKPGPPEYEEGVLIAQPRRSVYIYVR
jgi:hypothetical protein